MNGHWVVLLLVCGYSLFASAEEECIEVDSNQADYDGKQITLNGNVTVEHELGKIQANHIVLTPEEEEKKLHLAELKMNEDVKIALRDGAELTCAKAELDYHTMHGRFSGNAEKEYVIYTEMCRDKGGMSCPLIVKSRVMNVQLSREERNENQSPKSLISEITAESNVTVDYNQDFIASADMGMYRRLSDANSQPQNAMPGRISLRTGGEGGLCQVTNRNGDLIRAEQICIDTTKRHLHFAFPKGAIYAARLEGGVDRIDFSCDSMTWEEPRELLTLRDHVVVNQKGIGSLANDNEVTIYQYTQKGKKQLRTIESNGKTFLTSIDGDKNLRHHLSCYGKATLDHEHLQTILESPVDSNGNIMEGKQVFFEDPLGEIYADKVIVDYDYQNHEITPNKVTLLGHVRILNRKGNAEELTGALLQFALSDKVEFVPDSKEMLFSSGENRRVLFYDKANNVQVSAPALKIKREPGMKSESIQGVGDVRFSFVDRESDQMRKEFGLEEAKNNPEIGESEESE